MKKIIFLFLSILSLVAHGQTFQITFADVPPGPYLQFSPTSLSGLASFAGTRGSSSSVAVNWFQWTASADTVTAPTGFVVSVDNATFVSSLIFSTGTTSGAIPIYVALAAGNSPNSYSGNITFQAGPIVYTYSVSGITSGVASMSVSPTSLTLSSTTGSPGTPGTLTTTFAYLTSSVNVTIPTATVPLELSQDGGTTWASSLSFNSGSPWPIQARITAAAAQGSAVDTIQFASSGVSTIKIPVSATATNASTAKIDTLVIPTTATSATVTNFPIVFSGTNTRFKTVSQGGFVSNTNLYDMTFSRDYAGTSLLNWEIEKYDSVAGTVIAWIKTDSVSSLKNDTIYIRYHQPSITTFQGGAPGSVWDANYVGVWHMNQTVSGTGNPISGQSFTDYTSNANKFNAYGTWTSGQTVTGVVGSGIEALNANSNYLQWAASGTGGLTGDFTVECWAKITVQSNTSSIWGSPSFGNSTNFYSGQYRLYNGSDAIVDNTTTPLNTWTHLVVTRSGNNLAIYHNGVATTATQSSGFTYNFQNLFNNQGTFSQNIYVDEVRQSVVGRSSVWVIDEYNNMNGSFPTYKQGQ